MTIDAKKEVEYNYLKKFLEIVGINSSIEPGTEPPDYFIKIKELNIGVEITEFHSNKKNRTERCRREVEELWQKLWLYMSETIARDYPRLRNIYAQLYFKELEVPPRPLYPEFARQLFNFLLQNESKFPTDNRGKTVSLVVADAHSNLLNTYLTKIHLFYTPHCGMWTWNRSCAFVGLSEPELLNVIQVKNKKCRNGLNIRTDGNWLLIVSGFNASQSMGQISVEELKGFNNVSDSLKNGAFDRVYIFRYCDKLFSWEKTDDWKIIVPKKLSKDKDGLL
jgi:hypothetical protein